MGRARDGKGMYRRAPEHAGGTAGPVRLTPEEFARRHQKAAPLLWTVAAGVLGAPADAEDVLQEAALMALSKLDRYEPGTNFEAWMASFVRNVARNHGRKRRRRGTEPQASEVLDGMGNAPRPSGEAHSDPSRNGALQGEGVVDAGGRLEPDQHAFDDHVVHGLGRLSEDQRAALLLRSVHELSYREISDVLGIPEGTAMSHVHRARQSLRRHLRQSEELEERR